MSQKKFKLLRQAVQEVYFLDRMKPDIDKVKIFTALCVLYRIKHLKFRKRHIQRVGKLCGMKKYSTS